MSSWCDLRVDGFSVAGSRNYIEDVMLSLFHERDRRVQPDPQPRDAGEIVPGYQYAISAQAMRERLDAIGFTAARARADYTRGLAEHVAMAAEWDWLSKSERRQLRQKTYEHWRSTVGRLVPQGFPRSEENKWSHGPDAALMAQHGEYGLSAYFSDLRLLLRGVLDALPEAGEVVLDYTALVGAGYYTKDALVCAEARLRWARDQPGYGPIVLLTRGGSDARILAAAIEAMAPHLADLFGFLDFEGLPLRGSADALARTVRAFIGARVSTRMVAIFNNDTAGASARASLADIQLPPNIRTILLPPSVLGCDDPTTGTKAQVEERFLAILGECASPALARLALPDLGAIVDKIAGVFADPRDTPKPARRRSLNRQPTRRGTKLPTEPHNKH